MGMMIDGTAALTRSRELIAAARQATWHAGSALVEAGEAVRSGGRNKLIVTRAPLIEWGPQAQSALADATAAIDELGEVITQASLGSERAAVVERVKQATSTVQYATKRASEQISEFDSQLSSYGMSPVDERHIGKRWGGGSTSMQGAVIYSGMAKRAGILGFDRIDVLQASEASQAVGHLASRLGALDETLGRIEGIRAAAGGSLDAGGGLERARYFVDRARIAVRDTRTIANQVHERGIRILSPTELSLRRAVIQDGIEAMQNVDEALVDSVDSLRASLGEAVPTEIDELLTKLEYTAGKPRFIVNLTHLEEFLDGRRLHGDITVSSGFQNVANRGVLDVLYRSGLVPNMVDQIFVPHVAEYLHTNLNLLDTQLAQIGELLAARSS